jgi:signal transduction protein with GAF and PtsI domain
MSNHTDSNELRDLELLHRIGESIAAADPLRTILELVVDFASSAVNCDSCFVYILEEGDLILRASKNPHPELLNRLKLRLGQGITGWVAENGKPVAISNNASLDPRFELFDELPEDRYEALLSVPMLSRDRLVGVINLQHREPYLHSQREISLVAVIGFLVGPEIERAILEAEKAKLSELPEARRLVDRAKVVLQRDLRIDEEEAYLTLQRQSREHKKSMKEIAEAILLGEQIKQGSDRSVSC